jgi:arginyl-tRNA synthetase
MLIEHLKDEFPDFLTNTPPIADLQEFYKASKKRFDDDAAFKEVARKRVVALQAGDEVSRKAWQVICEVSRQNFQTIYDRLGITVEERGESYYNDLIPPLITELENRGLVVPSSTESDGVVKTAKVIFCTEKMGNVPPLMVQKSDGGYGYDSTDMACIYHRLVLNRGDWVIYVTDSGQQEHFFTVFDVAQQAGWYEQNKTARVDHVGFGVVLGEDGRSCWNSIYGSIR